MRFIRVSHVRADMHGSAANTVLAVAYQVSRAEQVQPTHQSKKTSARSLSPPGDLNYRERGGREGGREGEREGGEGGREGGREG